jgi:thioredoxin reductase (NADPH)
MGGAVVIVGGGNSAGQAALYLASHSARVTLLVRGDDLRQGMSRYLADQLQRDPNVEILHHAQVRELIANGQLRGVIVEDDQTGERRELEARALFIFIGADPQASWLGGQLALDDDGLALTGAVRAVLDFPAQQRAQGVLPVAQPVPCPARHPRVLRPSRCPCSQKGQHSVGTGPDRSQSTRLNGMKGSPVRWDHRQHAT